MPQHKGGKHKSLVRSARDRAKGRYVTQRLRTEANKARRKARYEEMLAKLKARLG